LDCSSQVGQEPIVLCPDRSSEDFFPFKQVRVVDVKGCEIIVLHRLDLFHVESLRIVSLGCRALRSRCVGRKVDIFLKAEEPLLAIPTDTTSRATHFSKNMAKLSITFSAVTSLTRGTSSYSVTSPFLALRLLGTISSSSASSAAPFLPANRSLVVASSANGSRIGC
jgi:hypothetical protein